MKTKVMVSKIGQINIRPSSKKDLCGICGRKTMANAVLCKYCRNWIHGSCAKVKTVTNNIAIDFKGRKFKRCYKTIEDPPKKLHVDVGTVIDMTYIKYI